MIIMFAGLTQSIASNNAIHNPTKYADLTNWQTLPGSIKHDVDVFFVYPTTYFPNQDSIGSEYSASWNQTIEQAKVDSGILAQVTSKSSVFYNNGGTNLYVPYYQQVSGRDYLNALVWKINTSNSDAATQGYEKAYKDVEQAFDYYLAHYNKGRPFILAGHSQGSMLLLTLLERKFSDPVLRKQLVAAYIIGWSVTSDDMSNYPNLSKLGICSSKGQTGCIVTYNTQQNPGDFTQTASCPNQPIGIVRANAYSVNPLTWIASNPNEHESKPAPATANLGALFYKFQSPRYPHLGPSLIGPKEEGKVAPNWESYRIGGVDVNATKIVHYTSAQNYNGALVVNPTELPAPGNYQNLNAPYNTIPGWYHNYDYSFFFFNLEQNVKDRIDSYNKVNNSPYAKQN